MLENKLIGQNELVEADSEGCYPLHRAASSGSAVAVQAIVELGRLTPKDISRLDMRGRNAMHWAAESGSASCVCAVYTAFGNTAAPLSLVQGDNMARTPVHVAVAVDAVEAVLALDELGASIDLPMGSTKSVEGSSVLVKTIEGSQRLGT